MNLFKLEHSLSAYRADFMLYCVVIVSLGVVVAVAAPVADRLLIMGLALLGMASGPLFEYWLHRSVLHGIKPFSTWHAEHHRRPAALICTPTLVSVALIAALVFLPVWLMGGLWPACAFTFGFLVSYLAYSITHHAIHHWRRDTVWLRQRKRWHARHHDSHRRQQPGQYGVTTALWARVFGTDQGKDVVAPLVVEAHGDSPTATPPATGISGMSRARTGSCPI